MRYYGKTNLDGNKNYIEQRTGGGDEYDVVRQHQRLLATNEGGHRRLFRQTTRQRDRQSMGGWNVDRPKGAVVCYPPRTHTL